MNIILHSWNSKRIWRLRGAGKKENSFNMDGSGLTSNEISAIRKVFSNHQQIEEVLIYGSRAMGNFKPASDIDLTIKGKDIDLDLQTEIEFELDDLMLPYKFDVTIYERITNPDFLDHINSVGKEVYKKENIKTVS